MQKKTPGILERYRHLIYGAIILLVTVSTYASGIGNEFIFNWDDPSYIFRNPDIQQFSLENISKIFTSYYVGNYAPLHMLSYMADYALWGDNPTAFFLVNLLLHTVNAMLLYRILCRLGMDHTPALLAVLLFAIHPVQVESVAWLSQRKNVLSLFLMLTSFYWYLNYCRAEKNRWRPYSVSCFFFCAALLTKSIAVILPAILLAYDFTHREGGSGPKKILSEKIPFVILAGIAAAVTLISQGQDAGGGIVAWHGGSPLTNALTALTVYSKYLFNLFWPLQLSAVYHVGIKDTFDLEVAGALALLLLTPATLLLFRPGRRKKATFWLTIFLGAFIPVSQIVPITTLMNDRYCYIPLLGLSPYLVLLGKEFSDRRSLSPWAMPSGVMIILLLITPITWQRTQIWGSTLTLWQDAARKQPLSATAWSHLGYAQEYAGQRGTAIDSYLTAIKLNPKDPELFANIGILQYNNSNYSQAIPPLEKTLQLQPDHRVWLDLALAYTRSLQHREAIKLLYEKGGGSESALTLLAINYYHLGQYAKAMENYREIQKHLSARDAAPINGNMALVALRINNSNLSKSLWDQAISVGLKPSDIYIQWARLEAIGNRREEALKWIEKALQKGRANRQALYNDPDLENLRANETFLKMLQRH